MAETYGEYSMMFSRQAGQFWSGSAPAGQWAWTPNADGITSRISWGQPSDWPPGYYELFAVDSVWVYLEGFGDQKTGEFLPQVVTSQVIHRRGHRATLAADPRARQRYALWTIPTYPYTIETVGYMTWEGRRVDYEHTATWSPPVVTATIYHPGLSAIKQTEVWRDNLGDPGGPLVIRHDRDHWMARTAGPAWLIQDRLHSWRADLRYWWQW